MAKCVIARHVEGISLNDYEFFLEDSGDIKTFASKGEAIARLKALGADEDDIYYMRFFDARALLEKNELIEADE